ncbi:unnamed protein product [Kuraishia capsulata CBS 1993]|uniref:Uncharacterized protein n=1 Tax=Kuraishia capsulata CBS 1993 TaxID=1382522 RepID=W6MGW7_9ASCO|nr:uncharacterized protein KUCA_T00000830001 [Kuraishia capsulata CBS 1993]CDK24863.1 unnamed protein product [Kuraishia capsulata CBS 1993]
MPGAKFYPQSTEGFSLELFNNPPADYRGAPLWSWNNKLNKEQLLYEIDVMKEMGFGGYHIHARAGLDTKYMGDEFMDLVQDCVEDGKERGMLTYLYDEDRWPSGSCGGAVVKANPEFRAKHLLMTKFPYGEAPDTEPPAFTLGSIRMENGKLVGVYSVELDKAGFLKKYTKLADNEVAAAKGDPAVSVWYAYLEYDAPSMFFNGSSYVDTLNKTAIDAFIQSTHEKYYSKVGNEFGKAIKSIFTDEPQFSHKSAFEKADTQEEAFLPWTTDLEDTFKDKYGYSLLQKVPELFWDIRDNASKPRYHYHDHVCERFNEAFVDNISAWCEDHGISLAGHMMHEEDLLTQTEALGEAMRSYRAFPLPGIDMLQDKHEYHTAKQAQSVSHQYNREGVLCEAYGVTDWNYTFQGHKSQGDWLAALGVTMRSHHLTWVSMRGQSKRDFPACIGYQSPWYKEYSLVESHYARLNTALTRGKAVIKIGVIHPIENYWLAYGPWQTSVAERQHRMENFDALIKWLLYGLLDFDYISESLLPDLNDLDKISNKFEVGSMAYDAIIVPSAKNLRKTTYDRLLKFASNGGKVIIMGETPSLVEVTPEPELISKLVAESESIPFNYKALHDSLLPFREVGLEFVNPKDPLCLLYSRYKENILYNMREESDGSRWLFMCNTDKVQQRPNALITLKGTWDLTGLDTLNGGEFDLAYTVDAERNVTEFYHTFHILGSLLLRLIPAKSAKYEAAEIVPRKQISELMLAEPVGFSLEDPNPLLLDRAFHKLPDGTWSETDEEIRRLDNILRNESGIPKHGFSTIQPYCVEDKKTLPSKRVYLRFEFNSEIDVAKSHLATEHHSSPHFSFDSQLQLKFDGEDVEIKEDGFFVDWDIAKVKLPAFKAGHHVIEYSVIFNDFVTLEWLYILGDFGVSLTGKFATIVDLPKTLAIGDYALQGLPFYGGNLIYNIPVADLKIPEGKKHFLRVAEFKGPVVEISLDDKRVGVIAFDPFEIELPESFQNSNILQIKVYGDRENTFGSLHNNNPPYPWCWPGAWSETGDRWTYLYRLGQKGLVNHPQIIGA